MSDEKYDEKCDEKYTETESVIVDMLTENTGRALCDSGGVPQYDDGGNYVGSKHGYGRQYERNQGRDFKEEPPARATIYEDECWVSVSLFHFLRDLLYYDAEMDERFYSFVEENDGRTWLSDMRGFIEHLSCREGFDTSYYMGEPSVFYTYNVENQLDQDIQFIEFIVDDFQYVILQSHNGCDARGGMSAPHVFEGEYLDGFGLFINECASLSCTNCYTRMDNSYDSWTYKLNHEHGRAGLDDFEVITIEDDTVESLDEARDIVDKQVSSSEKQLNLGGGVMKFDKDRAIRERFSEILGVNLDREDLFSWRIDDYDELGDYLSCPVCNLGRMAPVKLSY